MRPLLKLNLILLSIIILAFSCKKKDPDPPTTSTVTTLAETEAQVSAFFDKYKKASEVFTVTGSTGGVFTTTDGTVINIPPTAFVDENNNVVTGSITLNVVEYNKASEMIFGNRPTMTAGGEILETAGEYMITAKSGSNKLNIKPKSISLNIPVDSVNGVNTEMEGWKGDTSVQTTLSGYDYQNVFHTLTAPLYSTPGVLWIKSSGVSVAPTPTAYEVAFDSIGKWTNVDAINGDPRPKTTLFGYFNIFNDSTSYSSAPNQPSGLYFKPDGLNTVLKLTKHIFMPPTGYAGFHSYQNSMPIGMTGTFLAITFKDGKIYAQKKTNTAVPTPATGASYSFINFTLTEVSESDLVSMILSLD